MASQSPLSGPASPASYAHNLSLTGTAACTMLLPVAVTDNTFAHQLKDCPSLMQMKDKYANKKPYGQWLDAQVVTLSDLVESVPDHLLKVPTIQSRHKPTGDSLISSAGADHTSNGTSNGSDDKGTLSSSKEGGQVGVNATNGHSNPGAGMITQDSNGAFHDNRVSPALLSYGLL